MDKLYDDPCVHWMACDVCGEPHRILDWIKYNAKERLKGDPYREEPIATTLLMILGPCLFTGIQKTLEKEITELGLDED